MAKRPSPEFLAVVMIVVAAFLAALGDSLRIAHPLEDSAYVPKEEVITPEIELLQAYIRIDTSNPPGREIDAAKWLAGLIEEAGVEAEIIESAPGRANVYARLKGREEGDALLLTHHMDVVPASPEGWTEPPFAANVRMNQLYGRGTLDMKGIGICQLIAFLDLARSHATLERDVVFLAVADEETGGELGMAWIVRHRPDILEGVTYALNEGGVAESLRDEITYFGVEVGTKQMVHLQVRADERRVLEKARTAMLPLQSPIDVTRIPPEVPPTLAAMATHRVFARELLMDIERTIAEGDLWRLHRSYRVLMQNIAKLGGIEKDEAGLFFNVYLENLPDEEPQPIIDRVRSVVESQGARVEVLQVQGPSPVSSWSTPFYGEIESAVHEVYGDVAVGPQILQFTSNDSRYLRPLGIQAYGLWPFAVNLYQTFGIHGEDERVRLDWFMMGVDLTKRIVRGWAVDRQ